jgi:predicted TPR repeat methyltransferase
MNATFSGSDIEQLVLLGLQQHHEGQLRDAAEIYRRVLKHQPRNADALRLLGVIARQEGRFDEAVEMIRQSIAIDPRRAEAHHNLGDGLQSQGKLDEAITAYSKAVELRPDWAEAHGALGNALRERGNLDRALEEFKRVVQLRPGLASGFLSLAKAFHEQGQRGKAIAAYATAIGLKPDWADAHDGMGNLLWDEGRLEEAIANYSRAIEINPGHLLANWSMGKILYRSERMDESLVCFKRAVDLNPNNPKAHYFLARFLEKAGRSEEARAAYREAIRLSPDTPEWRFKLAALSGDGSVSTAPARYIRELFDEYAGTFERHLVEKLKYQAPQQMLESVRAATDRKDLKILDLGCGTGLCGQEFRPYAQNLVGVDLSPAMIRASHARGIYDRLITGELITTLHDSPATYDLIVAGDVLIYVGDLTDFMPAVAGALRSGGLFAGSIENYQGPGFFLHSEGRFAHSLDYVRQRAAACGLAEVSARQAALRRNAEIDVAGWIVVFGKT